jgi:hypothetical protein
VYFFHSDECVFMLGGGRLRLLQGGRLSVCSAGMPIQPRVPDAGLFINVDKRGPRKSVEDL